MKKTLIHIEGYEDIRVSFKGPTDARIQFMKVLYKKYANQLEDDSIKVVSVSNEGSDKGMQLESIDNSNYIN
jgi:hypothetical protein